MAYFESRPNSFVKAFIASDAFLYSSLNLVNILFAVFITTKVVGGTVQAATTAIAAGMIARIVTELLAGKTISALQEQTKVNIIIIGMSLISISYFGFALSNTLLPIIVSWIVNGIGWGLSLPTKMSLMSKYINQKQSNQEWGLTDALNMSLVVITMIIGGFIVTNYSYRLLFFIAAALNGIGLIPYFIFSHKLENTNR